MEKKEKKESKIKAFWNKHKDTIINIAIAVGSFAAGCAVVAIAKSGNDIPISDEDISELPSGKNAQRIDEDIFTRLAPEIEDFVLSDGVDEAYIEGTYTVEFPKHGNPDEGYYERNKKVEVRMYDVTE